MGLIGNGYCIIKSYFCRSDVCLLCYNKADRQISSDDANSFKREVFEVYEIFKDVMPTGSCSSCRNIVSRWSKNNIDPCVDTVQPLRECLQPINHAKVAQNLFELHNTKKDSEDCDCPFVCRVSRAMLKDTSYRSEIPQLRPWPSTENVSLSSMRCATCLALDPQPDHKCPKRHKTATIESVKEVLSQGSLEQLSADIIRDKVAQ